MPNRIIKESICRSDSIDSLSWFEEVLFYRLIVNCDDYGRFDGRPKIIKGSLFPLKDITDAAIEKALVRLSTAGLVTTYKVKEKPYLQLTAWNAHQQIRSKKSKYPAPECGQVIDHEAIGNHLISDDINCPRNPIQSESNPNPNPNAITREDAAGDSDLNDNMWATFDRFWKSYPKKSRIQDAKREWIKVCPTDEPEQVEKIMDALERWKRSRQWKDEGGRYIPRADNWLRDRAYESVPPAEQASPPKGNAFAQGLESNNYDFDELEKQLLGT